MDMDELGFFLYMEEQEQRQETEEVETWQAAASSFSCPQPA